MTNAMKTRDSSAIDDPDRSLIDKWVRFKIDLIGRLGEVKGRKVASKTAAQIIQRRLNPKQAIQFIKLLRQSLNLPTTPEVLFMPKPSETTRQQLTRQSQPPTAKTLVPGTAIPSGGNRRSSSLARSRQAQLAARRGSGVKQAPTKVVSGDLNILAEPENPYAITEITPTADLILGNDDVFANRNDGIDKTDLTVPRTAFGKVMYPYVPVRNPAAMDLLMNQNYPGGRGVPNPRPAGNRHTPSSMDTIYPFSPQSTELDKEFVRMDNLGTLLPPRAVMKPWQTAKQKLFQPGDFVINKRTHVVGQIKAIKGEEIMVSYGQGKYARVPMQDLAIYYGTIRKLKQNEGKDTVDLARLVGFGKKWKSPKVVKK